MKKAFNNLILGLLHVLTRIKTPHYLCAFLLFSGSPLLAAVSAEDAVVEAVSKNGGAGKVLSVRERATGDGKVYFQVKILQNGKVRIFNIPKG